MTATRFSLQEENVYKDIQDLVKKGSDNEKHLSTFLQRYMGLIAQANLEDDILINFTKAALIVEASAKIYGNKVDQLWNTLERFLESLKANGKRDSVKKKGGNEEEMDNVEKEVANVADNEEPVKKTTNMRRRKKLADALSSPDEFVEIDSISGLLVKSMNETVNKCGSKIKFYEEVPNLFIKNKSQRKRFDVCLDEMKDDRDDRVDCRLRDWLVTPENMLIKEADMWECGNEMEESNYSVDEGGNSIYGEKEVDHDSLTDDNNDINELMETDNLQCDDASNCMDNNLNDTSKKLQSNEVNDESDTKNRDTIIEAFNKSQESDLGKYPNVFVGEVGECLVDVQEVAWHTTKFRNSDAVATRKLRIRRTNKNPCKLCVSRKVHPKRGRKCSVNYKTKSLDSYFSPFLKPSVLDPVFAVLPDEEVYSAFNIETKLVEQLEKLDLKRNIYDAYHPEENLEENGNFLGFDKFETSLIRKRETVSENEQFLNENLSTEIHNVEIEDTIVEEELQGISNENEEAELEADIEAFEHNGEPLRHSLLPTAEDDDNNDVLNEGSADGKETLKDSAEYRKIVQEETTKSKVEKNNELAVKVAEWHKSISDRLRRLENRGPLDMDDVCNKIMSYLKETDRIEIAFDVLVQDLRPTSVTGLFYACLQLANEGNLDIIRADCPSEKSNFSVKAIRNFRYKQQLSNTSCSSISSKTSNESRLSEQPSTSKSEMKRCSVPNEEKCGEPKRKKRTEMQLEERDSSASDDEEEELEELVAHESNRVPPKRKLSADSPRILKSRKKNN